MTWLAASFLLAQVHDKHLFLHWHLLGGECLFYFIGWTFCCHHTSYFVNPLLPSFLSSLSPFFFFILLNTFSLFFTHAPSHCLCMLLTCSSCSTCSELFVQVSAVKATLVGPLSLSLWLSGSPLREPRGGCHYIHCQWDKHNGLALSVVWAQAWGWHQLLIRSTPVSLPPPPFSTPKQPCNVTPGSPSAQPLKTVTYPCF